MFLCHKSRGRSEMRVRCLVDKRGTEVRVRSHRLENGEDVSVKAGDVVTVLLGQDSARCAVLYLFALCEVGAVVLPFN